MCLWMDIRDSNARKDVHSKMNLNLQFEFRKWLTVFTVSNGATPQLQFNVCEQRWNPFRNLNNLPFGLPYTEHGNCVDFLLL